MSYVRLVAAALVSGAAGMAFAQDAPTEAPATTLPGTIETRSTAEALPEGETKVLQAIVMEVTGKARWRATPEAPWKDAAMNDVLDQGAEIRTGMRSSVALRVGKNATVVVESGTNFVIPELVQEGSVLRTRAAVKAGRADFKVDHVGLTNDFNVITPSSTLAVKGTTFSVDWGGLSGLQVRGAATNRINAIEMKYFLSNLKYFVSGEGKSAESSPEPAQSAWLSTVGGSTLMGEVASSTEFQQLLENGFALLGGYIDQKDLQIAMMGLNTTFKMAGGAGVPEIPDGGGVDVPGIELTDLQKFQLLCDNFSAVINTFGMSLDTALAKQLDYSLNMDEQDAYQDMVNQLNQLCFFYDPDDVEDPLAAFIGYMQSFCNHLEEKEATELCLTIANDVMMDFTKPGS